MGKALREFLPSASYLGRDKLDVTKWGEVGEGFWSNRPDVVIHTAAITDHQCPDIPALIETNIVGTQLVANYAEAVGAKLVYLSTHYVYPGEKGPYSEDADCRPIGAYAWTKYAGEQAVKARSRNYLIIRGSWYTPEKLKLWTRNGVVSDAYSSRESLRDAARKISQLVILGASHVYNIGGTRQTYEQILREEGHDGAPISRESLSLSYPFPPDSSVDTSKYKALIAA
jgi:dTDP-4-dehydrorhamnose reductase